jgi:hypothetical protein
LTADDWRAAEVAAASGPCLESEALMAFCLNKPRAEKLALAGAGAAMGLAILLLVGRREQARSLPEPALEDAGALVKFPPARLFNAAKRKEKSAPPLPQVVAAPRRLPQSLQAVPLAEVPPTIQSAVAAQVAAQPADARPISDPSVQAATFTEQREAGPSLPPPSDEGPALPPPPAAGPEFPQQPPETSLPAPSSDPPPAPGKDELPVGPAPLPAPPADAPLIESKDETPIRPAPLGRPLEPPVPAPSPAVPEGEAEGPLYTTPFDAPLGFSGPSGVLPGEAQQDNFFVPVEDRWRIGMPEWDRYGKGHPVTDDYPYVQGSALDPFNLNVLKGDYPLIGQHTFLNVTASLDSLALYHDVPIATVPFESTARPGEHGFFGRPDQFFSTNYFSMSFDLFHGDAAFRQADWRVKLTPVFDFNYLSNEELGVVSPDVTHGTSRARTFVSLQEWFAEIKIADTSPDFDFVSVRAGAQPFTSDFRGFIFSDTNRAIRIFGTQDSNREQFNVAIFRQLEKDTNSQLNTFDDRRQTVVIANYYIQDFIFPGYTTEFSVHYDHDEPSVEFDQNGFLVRPDPAGVAMPHQLDVAYLGWAGDGHINRFNISHASYWALGHDSMNPIANSPQDISAFMNALELSYDRDWARFRASGLWATGDRNPNNGHATGFDAIFDNPNFAGGDFSYWQRQEIHLLGVNLVNQGSLLPDLRASKIQGQANFVNPGLRLVNAGVDFDLTPKLRMINNINCLWFDHVESLQQFVYQNTMHHFIGVDLSSGIEYRPLLSNNIIFRLGVASLVPGTGFDDLYGGIGGHNTPLLAAFLETMLMF